MEQLPTHLTANLPVPQRIALLRQRVAEFRAAVLAAALDEIEAELVKALVLPLREQGAPPERVEAAEQQVAALTEAVQQRMTRPRPRPRRPRSHDTPLPTAIVTPITSGQWKAPKPEIRLMPR